MNKQEFAIRLLFWFTPYPLSKLLPRILARLLAGPAASTPALWAQPALDGLSQLVQDSVAYADSLLIAAAEFIPADQLSELPSSLQTLIADAQIAPADQPIVLPPSILQTIVDLDISATDHLINLSSTLVSSIDNTDTQLSTLSDVVSSLADYTPDQVSAAFSDAITSTSDLIKNSENIVIVIPSPPTPVTPPYIAPVPPLYIGPPGPTETPTRPIRPIFRGLRAVWFLEEFNTIDTDIWESRVWGTGVNSIVGGQLKMLSEDGGDYAKLESVDDSGIPETFIWDYFLTFSSGTGLFAIELQTGIHLLHVIFDPPNILKFRLKSPSGWENINVGNYMGTKKWWRFHYNGDTCSIYSHFNLVASDLTVLASSTHKGRRTFSCHDVASLFLDNVRIIYPV